MYLYNDFISDGVPACKRDNPKLDECLLNILKHAKPQLMRGIITMLWRGR